MITKAVSIIIPAYNAEKYIEKCLESIKNQLSEEDEILIIDDGSIDRTAEICKKYLNSQVRYIYQHNSGVSAARNKGISCSKGDWILFADADDFLFPKSLSKAKKEIDSETELIVLGNTSSADGVMNRQSFYFEETNNNSIKLLLSESANKGLIPPNIRQEHFNMWACWGRLYRKDILNKWKISFDSELFLGEDLLFNVAYLLKVHTVKFVDDIVYYYRPNDSSVTAKFQVNRVVNTLRLIEKLKNTLTDSQLIEEFQDDFNRFIAGRCIACYKLYFNHPGNQLTKEEKIKRFSEFLDIRDIDMAIQKTSLFNLSVGKKQRYEYGIYVILMRKRKIKILLNL